MVIINLNTSKIYRNVMFMNRTFTQRIEMAKAVNIHSLPKLEVAPLNQKRSGSVIIDDSPHWLQSSSSNSGIPLEIVLLFNAGWWFGTFFYFSIMYGIILPN